MPAPKVLLAPNVTFATGLVDTSQDIVDASVNVASALYAPTLNFAFAEDNTNLSELPVLKSIWSSVSAVILVSASASNISSAPFRSDCNGPPTAPYISTMKILAPDAGAVEKVICVPPLAKL